MTYISPKALTFEDFLSQYRDNPRYELADGELIDMEPTGPYVLSYTGKMLLFFALANITSLAFSLII